MADPPVIRTPDQRLRVFVSSTLGELAPERAAVREAIEQLRLVPVLFELGARPHPPRELYRAYLDQSQVFVGVYWQRYGWVAPGERISGLEDEYRLAGDRPRLLYLKEPAPDREPRLAQLLATIKAEDHSSYQRFATAEQLAVLVQQDLAVLLTERFEAAGRGALRDARQRARGALPSAVPKPLGTLVGREAELSAVDARLDGGARLVTVAGPGGIGKTRLALELADRWLARKTHEVHVVPLAGVEEADLLLATLAARLRIRVPATADAARALRTELAGRRLLIVLDNLEQLVDAAGELVRLLEDLPTLQLLVTSRRPLGVAGEQVWPLEPLAVPDPDGPITDLEDSPAVALFVERARASDPRFVLDERNAASVARVCRRLDGLPLAIELAAARVRLFPPAALLRRLDERLDVLVGGADRPARHRTLGATLDWSVRLLGASEREVYARLSVFRGGATLSAVEAVCDLDGTTEVAEAVASLLDHGLLTVTDDRDDDEPRVRMLRTVRDDAAARLCAAGEEHEVRRRHLDWYAALAATAQPYLCGPRQVRWMARIDPERENLRAAAETAMVLDEPGVLLEMAWDLYVYYHLRASHQEPEEWVRAALASDAVLDDRQEAIAATALAISALWRGEYGGVAAVLGAQLATFADRQLDFESAVVLLHLGMCQLAAGAYERAAATEREAIARFAAVGHDWGVGSAENLQGIALAALRDRDGARACHERALRHARGIGNAQIAAQANSLLAGLDLDADRPEPARWRLQEAAADLEAATDVVGALGALEVAGALALAEDAPDVALTALLLAGRVREQLRVPPAAPLDERVRRLNERVRARVDVDDAAASITWPDRSQPSEVLAMLRQVLAAPGS
jgi:predicted ATPase